MCGLIKRSKERESPEIFLYTGKSFLFPRAFIEKHSKMLMCLDEIWHRICFSTLDCSLLLARSLLTLTEDLLRMQGPFEPQTCNQLFPTGKKKNIYIYIYMCTPAFRRSCGIVHIEEALFANLVHLFVIQTTDHPTREKSSPPA